MDYLNSFREMISLRGLSGHTLKGYCTYIHSYLVYLDSFLHKAPEDRVFDTSISRKPCQAYFFVSNLILCIAYYRTLWYTLLIYYI